MCAVAETSVYRLCPLNYFSFHSTAILEVTANLCCKYNLVHTQRFWCIEGNYYSPGFTVRSGQNFCVLSNFFLQENTYIVMNSGRK